MLDRDVLVLQPVGLLLGLLEHLGQGRRHASRLAMLYMDGLARRGDLRPGSRALLRHLSRRFLLATVTNGVDRVQRSRLRVARLEAMAYRRSA